MRCALGGILTLVVAAATMPAQDGERSPLYRGLSTVLQLRVVCSNQHFGRIEDLVVEVNSGRITAAVVRMVFEDEARLVVVPYDGMQFEVQSNLWNLGTCRHEDGEHSTFDPATIKVRRGGDASDAEIEGAILVSSLMNRDVELGDGEARAQGLAIELRSGHVAFLDLAIGKERAGDRDLHPVPWAAFRWQLEAPATAARKLRLILPRPEAFLEAAPNLIEIIVQDPLRRARVYAVYGVPAPDFDSA